MVEFVSDIAFSPAVKRAQTERGSREGYAKLERKRGWQTEITDDLAAFIAARDSVYLATANAAGQPYMQHRGGPPGFLKPLDSRTLAFADFAGNKQYISLGNLSENDRALIFLMDYANRRRVKIWGRARVVEDDPALLDRMADSTYRGRPERVFIFEIAAWDTNCPQHITPRYTEAEIAPAVAKLQRRIDALEAELGRLRRADAAAPDAD